MVVQRPKAAKGSFAKVFLAVSLTLAAAGCGGRDRSPATEWPEASSNGSLVSDVESSLRAELLRADRDFARSVREQGLEAWVAAFDDDGVVLPADGPPAVGAEAIQDLFAPLFAEPTFDMGWVPAGAEVAASGEFGYTFGDWKTARAAEGGLEQAEGKYLTVWRKDGDGNWRVLADIGNIQPKATESD